MDCKATAGIGVYFGPSDPRNLSEKLIGKQTNNRAELTAAIRALEIAFKDPNLQPNTIVRLHTDSVNL